MFGVGSAYECGIHSGISAELHIAEVVADHDAPRQVEPGTIVEISPEGVVVACGDGALRITQLQKPGGKRLPVRDFLAGSTLATGQRFDLTQSQ